MTRYNVEYVLTHAEDTVREVARLNMELDTAYARVADLDRALTAARDIEQRWREHRWWHHVLGGNPWGV